MTKTDSHGISLQQQVGLVSVCWIDHATVSMHGKLDHSAASSQK